MPAWSGRWREGRLCSQGGIGRLSCVIRHLVRPGIIMRGKRHWISKASGHCMLDLTSGQVTITYDNRPLATNAVSPIGWF